MHLRHTTRKKDGKTHEIPVRSRHVRSERIRKAVTAAYGQKYSTKGSQKWVEGFAEPERELTTLEFVPR